MKITLKSFIAKSYIPAKLIRAVVRQVGGWESFKESASDVTEHGANCGFVGFTWYSDTVKFTKNNLKEIMQHLQEQARDFGNNSVSELISNFRCLRMTSFEVESALINKHSDNQTELYNALAWYCLEEIARNYVDFVSEE